MLEDGVSLGSQLLRAQWHAHLDVLNLPLCPSATIHPDAAILEPLCASFLLQVDGSQDGICTFLVGAMRVGKVACHIDLMRFHLLQEMANNLHILLCHRQFLDFSTLIERQVEEVYMIQRNLIVGTSGTSLATTYQTLDGQDVLGIEVALLLLCEELLDFLDRKSVV